MSGSGSDLLGGLRAATAGDAEGLAGLISAAYEVERHFVKGDRIDAAGVLDHLSRGTFLILPGDPRRRLCEPEACVYLEPRGEVGYLGMLSVAPRSQGRGLGHRLLSAGEDWLRRRGCDEVEIYVVDQRVELFPWYERRGYRVTGDAPFADVERMLRPCRFVILRKPLASLAAPAAE